ncbi:hypothetical protein ACIB24_04685 [Spongisporangium articulatum]|uniref:Uncharacterized protein n=1 Tax=Spongisporangium articulatum TaxID=3362603 RepID=A0ABW8AJ10_9ACTN
MTTQSASLDRKPRIVTGLSAPVLVGGTILLSTGFQLIVFGIGMFVASQAEIDRDEGVRASLVSISVVAAVSLVIAFAVSLSCRGVASRAAIGAVALGALAVISLPAFWAGAPAIFGANAAWLGGLTIGSTPQRGAARGFAIVGLVVAVLNAVAIPVLTGGSLIMHGYAG